MFHLLEGGCSVKHWGHTEVAQTPSTHLLPHQAPGREAVPSTEGNLSDTELSFTELSCHILQSKSTRNKPLLPANTLLLLSLFLPCPGMYPVPLCRRACALFQWDKHTSQRLKCKLLK